LSAIGQLQGNFFAPTVDYSVELIEGEHYLCRYRRACCIRFPEKEVFGRFQRLIGIQCGVHICYIG